MNLVFNVHMAILSGPDSVFSLSKKSFPWCFESARFWKEEMVA